LTTWLNRRWRGEVPAAALCWRDMLLVGTLVNLGASFAGLMAYAQGAGLGWAVALHFGALPLNLFLLGCLWRLRERSGRHLALAAVWFVAMLVV
jgi:hypothetical protein